MAIKWNAGSDESYDYSNGYANPTKVARPTWDGLVLALGVDHGVQIMSDVWESQYYALVWDGTKTRKVSYHTTGWNAEGTATVDATPEVIAAANLYILECEREELRRRNAEYIREAVERAKRIEVGKELEVVRGRKVPIGTVGRCFWYGNSGFGPSVGLELANGSRVFTAEKNVIVAQPDEFYVEPSYLLTEEQIDARARKDAKLFAVAA